MQMGAQLGAAVARRLDKLGYPEEYLAYRSEVNNSPTAPFHELRASVPKAEHVGDIGMTPRAKPSSPI